MAVVKTRENECGACPRCEYLYPLRDWVERASGELSDGVMWTSCPNCQEELTLKVVLSFDEVVS